MTAADSLLDRLEAYYDAAPRGRSKVEEIGPFTLFVAASGWPYYARPRLRPRAEWSRQARPPEAMARPARPADVTVGDVRAMLGRQRQLGVPQALEWIDQVTPGLAATVRAAGAAVEECPLLVLDGEPVGSAGTARMLEPSDRAGIAAAQAAISVGFQHGGTATGPAGLDARDAQAGSAAGAVDDETVRDRLASGAVRMAAVCAAGEVVGGGSHIRLGQVSEVVGVAVLPAYRRRGFARHLTYVLADDARRRGVTTVFCSAQSADVARVYEAVGFRRVGTACIASAG